MPVITVGAIQKQAISYDPELKMLMYLKFEEVLNEIGFNYIPNVDNKHVKSSIRRKANIAVPYAVGAPVIHSDLMKICNTELQLYPFYGAVKDNLENYSDVLIIRPGEKKNLNQKPTEGEIIQQELDAVVITFGEDAADALFHGKRDLADRKLGHYDGILTKLDDGISADLITPVDSGSLVLASNTDTTPFDNLIVWLNKAHPFLLKYGLLYMTRDLYLGIAVAACNKYQFSEILTLDELERRINILCKSNIKLVVTDYMGVGDRIILTMAGNFDFGFRQMSDMQFVRVTTPYECPDDFQIYIKTHGGTRINYFDPKTMHVNLGTLTPRPLSGDYTEAIGS